MAKQKVSDAILAVRREQAETQKAMVHVDVKTVRARSDIGFAGHDEPMTYLRACYVDTRNGDVLAWDSVAQHYSRHHDLTESEIAQARELAGLARRLGRKAHARPARKLVEATQKKSLS